MGLSLPDPSPVSTAVGGGRGPAGGGGQRALAPASGSGAAPSSASQNAGFLSALAPRAGGAQPDADEGPKPGQPLRHPDHGVPSSRSHVAMVPKAEVGCSALMNSIGNRYVGLVRKEEEEGDANAF